MRWSQTFIQTLRESPQEAEIRSHRLMIRAGMIQKLSSGLYTFLPLGLRSLRKLEKIIRNTLDRHGAIELLMPILQPKEIWLQSGRWDLMRDLMLVSKDRQNREFVLGPTHEEVITDFVSKRIKSYRDLPKNFYQIQTKFRDELRPRFGLMRAREFLMKDAYSFDRNDPEAEKSYWNMVHAYQEIFSACGLNFRMVEADTGVMGGSLSHEFVVLSDSGEDEIFVCTECGYSSNRELTRRLCRGESSPSQKAYEKVKTPNVKSIGDVSQFLGVSPKKLIKTMIYKVGSTPIAVLCRGDVELSEGKIARYFKSDKVNLADEKTIKELTHASVGFSGPVGLKAIQIVGDLSVEGLQDIIVGANEDDFHLAHVDLARDCKIDFYGDFGLAQKGDLCFKCRKEFETYRGIEVGHVFKLGTKYSSILGAKFLNEEGLESPCVMGCFGIGVSRTLQAFVDQNSTENEIFWSPSLAPFEIVIVPILKNEFAVTEAAEKVYQELIMDGYDVLLDDRDERPGVKFKDAELIGFPVRITLGQKYLKELKLEVSIRTLKETRTEFVSPDSLKAYLNEFIKREGRDVRG